ncbi:hypothetical protein F5Y17DRAFT_426044 [Xylariaceae sp. FL0594]|nr:hypothetical protein F5Y17DRAFT_426044 [Xylariaceae sp. FL0594]
MCISADELDLVHNVILTFSFAFFLFTHASYIRRCATVMADTLSPPTTPKKLFKPSSKITTPTAVKKPKTPISTEKSQPPQPKPATQSTSTKQKPQANGIAGSSLLAPLTNVSNVLDSSTDHGESDTTGGLGDAIPTPADTASGSGRDSSSDIKDKISDTAGGLLGAITEAPKGALESVSDSLPIADTLSGTIGQSPSDIANYFREHGNPEMGAFVQSLIGGDESASTPKATPSGDVTPTSKRRTNNVRPPSSDDARESSDNESTGDAPAAADVSKVADGTFRDAQGDKLAQGSTGKMGQPDVSSISKTAEPAVQKPHRQPGKSSEDRGKDDAPVVDNMGQPAHVEKSIEIPLQRPGKGGSSRSQSEKSKPGDLGDPKSLRSTDDLPNIPGDDSQDPPEEMLDPSVHSASRSISPIPKIPKIEHISSPPPVDLPVRVKGLAGYVVDDVGNIVDGSGKVLGHATGDLPEMIGRKVSETGEIYGDGGEIIGYVSENFVNPPPPPAPVPIPADFVGSLKVDHEGNILDSDGNIIGRFHKKPGKNGAMPPFAPSATPKGESAKTKENQEPRPKTNAQTGGSPSDLYLDVKSTNDGIQLTIRIPTMFSQPPKE